MDYRTFTQGNLGIITLQDYPQNCPECHNKITPNYHSHAFSKNATRIFAFLSCPNPKCDMYFVAQYNTYITNSYAFEKIIKGQPKSESFPSEIKQLSSSFVKIYNEAFTAEQLGLFEISGVGYRKALEFLIKDYLINKSPDRAEQIKSMFLGKCINDLVEDNRIKETAKRAVWLGNDQTHYIKKWEDKDLADLKKMIRLTVNWVESEIITSDLQNSMPE